MASLERARAARREVVLRLGDDPAVASIGLAPEGDGYVVSVKLSDRPKRSLPEKVNGVAVVVSRSGTVFAQ
jgi:hypothetical protein